MINTSQNEKDVSNQKLFYGRHLRSLLERYTFPHYIFSIPGCSCCLVELTVVADRSFCSIALAFAWLFHDHHEYYL